MFYRNPVREFLALQILQPTHFFLVCIAMSKIIQSGMWMYSCFWCCCLCCWLICFLTGLIDIWTCKNVHQDKQWWRQRQRQRQLTSTNLLLLSTLRKKNDGRPSLQRSGGGGKKCLQFQDDVISETPKNRRPVLSSNGGGAGGNTKDTLPDSVGDLDALIVGVAEILRGKYRCQTNQPPLIQW